MRGKLLCTKSETSYYIASKVFGLHSNAISTKKSTKEINNVSYKATGSVVTKKNNKKTDNGTFSIETLEC